MDKFEHIDDARWQQLIQEEAERRRHAEAYREKLARDLDELYQWYSYEANYYRQTFNRVMQEISNEKQLCRQQQRVYLHNMTRLYEGLSYRLHDKATVDKECLHVCCKN